MNPRENGTVGCHRRLAGFLLTLQNLLPVRAASAVPSQTRATWEPLTHLQTLSAHPFQQQVQQTGK